ncbi:MAG TPA: hypothetical protein VE981_21245 [Planctomycetota bacterium]|nr:hypothetical protein [Planctomycetota bacterium]
MPIRLAVLLFPTLVFFLGQDAAKPQEAPDAKWKIDVALTLVQKDGKWVFHIDGVTNIPADVKLRGRIYAMETFADFKEGERDDEEPLVWEDDSGQPAFHLFNPEGGGQIHEDVYAFVRPPYSIKYRARVHYNPRDQTPAVTLKMGDEEFSRKADLRLGTDADYARELQDRVKEVADDLVQIEKLYGDFVEVYPKFLVKFDVAAWNKWKDLWLEKIEAIEKRNDTRYSLWAVWMERQAKMRVGGMCELMARRMIGAAEGHFLQGLETKPRVQELIKGFHDYFEEAIEVIGVSAPLDIRTVGPLVAQYEQALKPLRDWVASRKGEAVEIAAGSDAAATVRAARRDGIGALLQLAPLLQNRKRGYLYVNTISVRFTHFLEILDGRPAPDALKKGMAELDAALVDFKTFAGLK